MLLSTKDGIRCDVCGSVHRDKFAYYSMDCSVIKVNTAAQMVSPMPGADSFDMCDGCYNEMLSKCKENLGAVRRGQTKCDICPTYMTGVYNYTRSLFTKVNVDIKCKESPMASEKKYMDFNICEKCKSELVNKVNKTKELTKDKGDWS